MTIQRAWRDYKGLPDPVEESTTLDDIDHMITSFASNPPSAVPSMTKKSSQFMTKKESQLAARSKRSSHATKVSWC